MAEKSSEPSQPQQFRFGILCNSLQLEQWQSNAISLLIEAGHSLELIVLNDTKNPAVPILEKLRHYPFNRLFFRLWDRFVFRPASKKPTDISQLTRKAKVLACAVSLQGVSSYFSKKDVETIQSFQLDFLLRFGFNIIRGDILNVAKHGIWSFHHDDEEVVRGGPPGFWEVYHRMHTNAVILQQLNHALDKGIILKKVRFRTIKHAYRAHLDQLYFESARLPVQVCKELMFNPGFAGTESNSQAPIYHPPKNVVMLAFWMKMAGRRVLFHLNDLFRQEDWNIGLIETPLDNFVRHTKKAENQVKWFKKPSASSYLADPFLAEVEGEQFVFFEQFDYKKGKAVLSFAREKEDFKLYHPLLAEDFHLSFPFVLTHEKECYVIPECFEAGKINVYRFDPKREKLVFHQSILQNIHAVDPVLHHHNGLWYLFFTTKEMPSVHLYVYWAEQPFGPYLPHHNNPVKTDVSNARMAGSIFRMNGKLIRPAQDNGAHYGTAVILNEITKLTPDCFEEKMTQRLEPLKTSEFNQGLHTLNGNTRFTVIDGKRFVFTFAGFMRQLRQKFQDRKG